MGGKPLGYGRSMSPPLEIARAVPGEHPAILALHREAGWPGTHVDGEVWVVRAGEEVIATAQLIELEPPVILIDAVVVRGSERGRGRGIGTELMRTVLATHAAEWWLECRAERIAFYERLGFELMAEAPGSVSARVGENATREQHFLRLAPLSP
jgi:GNAT superfamily N-acetyltransferase